MLADFHAAYYRVDLTAGDKGLVLPPYKGSTLRGGFGTAFRRIACACRQEECKNCMLQPSCPYAYIFETSPPADAKALSKYESIPRPFVLEPPLDNKTLYQKGESLSFGLILIGRSIPYLPYFILAFKELGEIGIGKGRNPYRLERLVAVNPFSGKEAEVYSHAAGKVFNRDLCILGKELLALKAETAPELVKIDFQTMTRIKSGDIFVRHVEFHMLLRALLRRLSALYYFHHGLEWNIEFVDLIKKAELVTRVSDQTRWVDWERYSHRQDARMNLGGIVGQATYKGELAEFLPILKLGELVHVGKACTFGMGKYRMSL